MAAQEQRLVYVFNSVLLPWLEDGQRVSLVLATFRPRVEHPAHRPQAPG